MHVGITGASGFLGTALSGSLTDDGCRVTRFVRRAARGTDEVQWRPGETLDPRSLVGMDAIVHLAGAGVGDRRWTAAYKHEILRSRVDGTATIARAIAECTDPPAVLVSGSAVGYYGDTGDVVTDESGPRGDGFLAEVVAAWEEAADPAQAGGTRVAFARTGLVVAADGGAWQRLFPLFRLGLGGRLGSGDQYWPTISLRDEIRGLRYLIDQPIRGVVNLVGPDPQTNAAVTKAMGRTLHRPAVLPVPGFAIRTAIGEFARETLISQRIVPGVLLDSGFQWLDPDVDSQLRAALGTS